MIPNSPLTGLERIARGLREVGKFWSYYLGEENYITRYMREMHTRVQALAEVVTPAIEHLSVEKVEFYLGHDLISLRAALGRQANQEVETQANADLCVTEGSATTALWAEHNYGRARSRLAYARA